MKLVNIAEIKEHLSDYLKEVESGNDIGICRRNIPIARLVAAHPAGAAVSNRTKLGCGRGTVNVSGDLTEPMMPATDWTMLGGDASDEIPS